MHLQHESVHPGQQKVLQINSDMHHQENLQKGEKQQEAGYCSTSRLLQILQVVHVQTDLQYQPLQCNMAFAVLQAGWLHPALDLNGNHDLQLSTFCATSILIICEAVINWQMPAEHACR